MAKHTLYGMVIVASALTSLPVLAQTSTSTATSTPPSMAATSGTTTPVTEAPRTSASTYYTADNELRASKLVGASVYNDQDQSIGSISDILLNNIDHRASVVVISVGGFLGVGGKLVSAPFDQIKIVDNKVVMPGATKASLESMPGFDYSKT
jgi:sporulation protein YlmC with PRC-barrel domain